jgi:hypothetical protein
MAVDKTLRKAVPEMKLRLRQLMLRHGYAPEPRKIPLSVAFRCRGCAGEATRRPPAALSRA